MKLQAVNAALAPQPYHWDQQPVRGKTSRMQRTSAGTTLLSCLSKKLQGNRFAAAAKENHYRHHCGMYACTGQPSRPGTVGPACERTSQRGECPQIAEKPQDARPVYGDATVPSVGKLKFLRAASSRRRKRISHAYFKEATARCGLFSSNFPACRCGNRSEEVHRSDRTGSTPRRRYTEGKV
jgi:hypothetical protein